MDSVSTRPPQTAQKTVEPLAGILPVTGPKTAAPAHPIVAHAATAETAPATARNQVSTAQAIAEAPAVMEPATGPKTAVPAIPTAGYVPSVETSPATARRPLSTALATVEATAAMEHAMVRNQRRTAQPIAEAPAVMEPVTGPRNAVLAQLTAGNAHSAAMAAVTGQSTVATARWIAAPAEVNSAAMSYATA